MTDRASMEPEYEHNMDSAWSGEQPQEESQFERHDFFYFDQVTFLVENCLFRVPRHPFMKATVFRDMFDLPVPDQSSVDGCSDLQPLRLDGIKKTDFLQLLRVMFPSPLEELDDLRCTEWISVLRLATMWSFDNLRDKSIAKLSEFQIEPIAKIELARECNVTKWLSPCINEWARGNKSLSAEDFHSLGLEFILKMAQVRDCALGTTATSSTYCDHCGNNSRSNNTRTKTYSRATYDFTSDIQRIFVDELKQVEGHSCASQ